MKKSMLEKYTSRYDKVPSWLMIMLSCFIASGYVLIGGVKVVEKRPIRTLGFFKGNICLNLLKGWGFGTLLLLASFLGTSLLGGLEFVKVDFSQRIFIYLLSLIPF